jgi:hypothetical protein
MPKLPRATKIVDQESGAFIGTEQDIQPLLKLLGWEVLPKSKGKEPQPAGLRVDAPKQPGLVANMMPVCMDATWEEICGMPGNNVSIYHIFQSSPVAALKQSECDHTTTTSIEIVHLLCCK